MGIRIPADSRTCNMRFQHPGPDKRLFQFNRIFIKTAHHLNFPVYSSPDSICIKIIEIDALLPKGQGCEEVNPADMPSLPCRIPFRFQAPIFSEICNLLQSGSGSSPYESDFHLKSCFHLLIKPLRFQIWHDLFRFRPVQAAKNASRYWLNSAILRPNSFKRNTNP